MLWTVLLVVLACLLVAAFAVWLIGERGRLLRPSTRRMIREEGWRRFLSPTGLRGYLYGRWTRLYLVLLALRMRLFGRRARRRSVDRYHGKVLTPEHASAIITLDRKIERTDLEQIVPWPVARDLLLDGPPDVAAYECACRGLQPNPCQPTQVCMVVGQPFVDFVLEHHPGRSRRLTRDEAVTLLREEHERGHVQSAWFKDVMLGRFYAICNCCRCCCGALAATRGGTTMVASSGYIAEVDSGACTACGRCADACAFGAIQMNGSARVLWEKCMGCGVCAQMCPADAVALRRDERKGTPLDVRAL
jgi:ferredoxin